MLVSQGSLVCNWITASLIPKGWMSFNISITGFLVYNHQLLVTARSSGGCGRQWAGGGVGNKSRNKKSRSSDVLSLSWLWGLHPKDWKLGQVTLLRCRPISDFQTTRKKKKPHTQQKTRPKDSDKWFSEMTPKILSHFTKKSENVQERGSWVQLPEPLILLPPHPGTLFLLINEMAS